MGLFSGLSLPLVLGKFDLGPISRKVFCNFYLNVHGSTFILNASEHMMDDSDTQALKIKACQVNWEPKGAVSLALVCGQQSPRLTDLGRPSL